MYMCTYVYFYILMYHIPLQISKIIKPTNTKFARHLLRYLSSPLGHLKTSSSPAHWPQHSQSQVIFALKAINSCHLPLLLLLQLFGAWPGQGRLIAVCQRSQPPQLVDFVCLLCELRTRLQHATVQQCNRCGCGSSKVG